MDSATFFTVVWNLFWFTTTVWGINKFLLKKENIEFSLLWFSLLGFVVGSFVVHLLSH